MSPSCSTRPTPGRPTGTTRERKPNGDSPPPMLGSSCAGCTRCLSSDGPLGSASYRGQILEMAIELRGTLAPHPAPLALFQAGSAILAAPASDGRCARWPFPKSADKLAPRGAPAGDRAPLVLT